MKRIDQWLANLGYCSRREARDWLSAGRVVRRRPSGAEAAVTEPGERAPAAELRVDGQPLDHPEGLLIALNKPVGRVCSHDPREGPNVFDLLPERWRRRNPSVEAVGRLDRESSGLLLLTDMTGLAHRLTSPKHGVPKTYAVTLDAPASPATQAALIEVFSSGSLRLEGEDKPCLPAQLTWQGADAATVILEEGRYHQVRRMFAARGHGVQTLHRLAIGRWVLPQSVGPSKYMELPLDTGFD